MFGNNNIRCLPSCNSYEGAVRIYKRAPSKPTPNWPEGTRPLAERRNTHYQVIADGDKVVFRLHNTNVVEWHGPTTMTLDSSWDSISTRQFADRFTAPGISFKSRKGEGFVVLYDTDKEMRRGIHTFTRGDDGVWRPTAGRITKPKRTVVDKDKAAETSTKIADFLGYARAIFAVCGNDGTHPWLNKEAPWDQQRHRIDADALATKDPDAYEQHMQMFLSVRRTWQTGPQYLFAHTDADAFAKAVRAAAYKSDWCYIDIDYDAPVPKRTKK